MESTGPSISVFARFPLTPIKDEHYLNPNSWQWMNCLTFRVETLIQLELWPKPYEWLRYAVGVVVGVSGHLRNAADSTVNLSYDDTNWPDVNCALYYHTTDEERLRQFPTDPQLADPHSVTSAATTRRSNMRGQIVARDECCVVSSMPELTCEVAHLLAHSKGDAYIEACTRARVEAWDEGELITQIDDVRNGILVNASTHKAVDKQLVAFLRVPNFAMQDTNSRCLYQVFHSHPSHHLIPSNTEAGIAAGANAPSPILFDCHYAAVVMRWFRADGLPREHLKSLQGLWYPGGATTSSERGRLNRQNAADKEDRQQGSQDSQHQDQAVHESHQEQEGRDGGYDVWDMVLYPYLLGRPEGFGEAFREEKRRLAELARENNNEKIKSWRQAMDE